MGSPEECSKYAYRAIRHAAALAKLSVSELLKRGFREEAKERIDELQAENEELQDKLQALKDE